MRKKCLKFYQFLILLSGDISLNPGPSQYLQGNDNKFQPFHKRGLHFLHINANSLLLKSIQTHQTPKIEEILLVTPNQQY